MAENVRDYIYSDGGRGGGGDHGGEGAPDDLYPAIVARIQDCLEGANPVELLATTERGGSWRADALMANVRALPEEAWQDALRPRSDFVDELA